MGAKSVIFVPSGRRQAMKKIKISVWILCGLACILIASICLVGSFSYSAQDFKKVQNNYFTKVEYFIEGNVINWQEVGGPYYLIKLEPTRFELSKNVINPSDDYVGVFTADTSKVFIIAPVPSNFSSSLERIKLNTSNRQFVFNDTAKSTLRTATLYKYKLPSGSNYIPF